MSIIAAMDVTAGEVISQRIRRNDSAAFISFLTVLDQHIAPGLRIHLIMDNGSSHTSKATRAWLAAHPRFAVTHTPKHASWLNMTEQWFGVLTRKLLRRGDFTLPRRPRNADHRIHHQAQRDRAPLQAELRRRRRPRPLPRTPSQAGQPRPGRMTATHRNRNR